VIAISIQSLLNAYTAQMESHADNTMGLDLKKEIQTKYMLTGKNNMINITN
jgi:hypothetical protein